MTSLPQSRGAPRGFFRASEQVSADSGVISNPSARFLDLLAKYEGQGRKLSHKTAAKDYAGVHGRKGQYWPQAVRAGDGAPIRAQGNLLMAPVRVRANSLTCGRQPNSKSMQAQFPLLQYQLCPRRAAPQRKTPLPPHRSAYPRLRYSRTSRLT